MTAPALLRRPARPSAEAMQRANEIRNAILERNTMTPVFEQNGWPIDNIPPAELRAMARYRDELGNELSAAGDYRGAEHHWRMAEIYRDRTPVTAP